MCTQQWWAPRSPSTHLWLASTGHLEVLIKNYAFTCLVIPHCERKVPPEMFRHLQYLVDTVAFFMSLFSVFPDLGLGMTEIFNVLVNAL